jgi:hypothetical protein
MAFLRRRAQPLVIRRCVERDRPATVERVRRGA